MDQRRLRRGTNQIIITSINNPLTMSIHRTRTTRKTQHLQFHGSISGGKNSGAPKEFIRESLSDFQNIEHRLEFVDESSWHFVHQ